MSSGFTSGGSLDKPIERDDEWRKAQQELEGERKRKAELERQHQGKSLYEVLQSNKAAKQDAFEEALKLKNQFRSLDDDEIDFLDSVLESQREKELKIKKDTESQIAAFRKQREHVEKSSTDLPAKATDIGSEWNVAARKRKAAPEKSLVKGVKLRKTSSTDAKSGQEIGQRSNTPKNLQGEAVTSKDTVSNNENKKFPAPNDVKSSMLAGYSSDEDD